MLTYKQVMPRQSERNEIREHQYDLLRMIFGFLLLVIYAILAAAIAIHHVEEPTSYGLLPLLTMLATLGGGFCQWAFSSPRGLTGRRPRPEEPPVTTMPVVSAPVTPPAAEPHSEG